LFSLKYKEKVWTQSDLGKRLVVTRASVTSVLDKLESKGLVARQAVEGNRRIYHIDLTPAGRALIDEVEPRYRRDVYEVMADLDEAACRALTENLERIRERCLR
jgi:DNA-binding MarR family transcriptional regulator